MNHSSYSVEVLVNGKPVQEFVHSDKIFVEGKKGTRYSLRVKNSSWKRVLAVITVDGLNVLTGKKGNWSDRGYIVGPWDAVTIDGWRTSDDTVREFYFSDAKDSYASKRKDVDTGVTGVIGIAVFEEEEPIRINYVKTFYDGPFAWFSTSGTSTLTTYNASNTTQTSLSANNFVDTDLTRSALGTGFGDEKESKVYSVSFKRASGTPNVLFEMYYRTSKELEKLGVKKRRPQYVSFPENDGYCPVVE